MKFYIIFILLFVTGFLYPSNDETHHDHNDNDRTADLIPGNKWFSRRHIFAETYVEMGVTGVKEYLSESILIAYSFQSANRNLFTIRTTHTGYAPGLINFPLQQKNFFFNVLLGFEYLYKIFGSQDGIYVWLDVGGSNKGFSFNVGVGVGSRKKSAMEFQISYLQSTGVFSRLDFYFVLVKLLSLRGRMGIDITFKDNDIDIFTFMGGMYIGISVKETFRIELGGGFTVNDYSIFRGFGGIHIACNVNL